MSGWDTDPGMELEAMLDERLEADREMAGFEREARAADRLRRRGGCPHSSRVERSKTNGAMWAGELPGFEALELGSEVCRECGKVFGPADEANWGRRLRAQELERELNSFFKRPRRGRR